MGRYPGEEIFFLHTRTVHPQDYIFVVVVSNVWDFPCRVILIERCSQTLSGLPRLNRGYKNGAQLEIGITFWEIKAREKR